MKFMPGRARRAALLPIVAAMLLAASVTNAKVGNPTLIPANSAYVFSIPDVPAFWTAWKQNAIYATFKKVMDSPDLASNVASFENQLKTIESALGFPLNGETMAQVVKSVDVYIAPAEMAGQVHTGMIATISDKQKLQKLLDLGEKAAATAASDDSSSSDTKTSNSSDPSKGGADIGGAAPGSNPISSTDYKGVAVKRFSGNAGQELFYAISGDLLLGGNTREEIQRIIDLQKGGTGEVLSASADYKKVEGGLAGHAGELFMFTNATQAFEMNKSQAGMAKLQQLIRRIAPVDYSGASIKLNAKDITTYSYAPLSTAKDAEAARALISKSTSDKPIDVVSFAPAETLMVFATTVVDAKVYYDMFEELMNIAGGAAGKPGQAEDSLKLFEMQLGFSIKDDLVPALGSEAAFLLNSVKMGGGMIPAVDAELILKIKDKSKINRVLTGTEKFVNAMTKGTSSGSGKAATGGMKSATAGSTTIKYYEIPAMPTFSPGFALVGDYLIIGTNKDSIQAAVERKGGKGEGLAGSSTLKSVGGKVSTNGVGFSYVNLDGVWSTVSIFSAALPIGQGSGFGKIIDVLKVFRAMAGNTVVKDNALIQESVVSLQ